MAGRGAGKSYIGALDLLLRSQPNCDYLVVGPTSAQLRDTSYRTFKNLAHKLNLFKSEHLSTNEITLRTGALVRFRSADVPDRLRGSDITGCWIDEASLMDEESYRIIQATLRQHGKQGWISTTMTPKGLSHWSYRIFGNPSKDTDVYFCSTSQNPFLPQDFYSTLIQEYGNTNFARQELEGAFVSLEGAEYPSYYFDNIHYQTLPNSTDHLAHILAIDNSYGPQDETKRKSGTGDDAAFCHLIIDKSNTIYVHQLLLAKLSIEQIPDKAVELINHINNDLNSIYSRPPASPPHFSVILDTAGIQRLVANQIIDKLNRLNLRINLNGYSSNLPKEARIRGTITQYLHSQSLKINSTLSNTLLNQLRDFPLCCKPPLHDDAIDALSMGIYQYHYLCNKKLIRNISVKTF